MLANQTTVERRIARVARWSGKLIAQLRRAGELEAAQRLEATAIEVVEQMRATRV